MKTKLLATLGVAVLVGGFFSPGKSEAAVIRLSATCNIHNAVLAAETNRRVRGCRPGGGIDTIDFGNVNVNLNKALRPINSNVTFTSSRNATINVAPGVQAFTIGRKGTANLNNLVVSGGSGGALVQGKLNMKRSYFDSSTGCGITGQPGARISMNASGVRACVGTFGVVYRLTTPTLGRKTRSLATTAATLLPGAARSGLSAVT